MWQTVSNVTVVKYRTNIEDGLPFRYPLLKLFHFFSIGQHPDILHRQLFRSVLHLKLEKKRIAFWMLLPDINIKHKLNDNENEKCGGLVLFSFLSWYADFNCHLEQYLILYIIPISQWWDNCLFWDRSGRKLSHSQQNFQKSFTTLKSSSFYFLTHVR